MSLDVKVTIELVSTGIANKAEFFFSHTIVQSLPTLFNLLSPKRRGNPRPTARIMVDVWNLR
jgi:hypothetical protein